MAEPQQLLLLLVSCGLASSISCGGGPSTFDAGLALTDSSPGAAAGAVSADDAGAVATDVDAGAAENDAGYLIDAGSPPDAGPADTDGGDIADAGATADSGVIYLPPTCDPDAGPPLDGGLTWHPEVPATATPPQQTQWVAVSDDPECASLAPGPIPPRLSWSGPDGGAACDPATVDSRGNLAAVWLSAWGGTTSYFPADGSSGADIKDGWSHRRQQEAQVWLAPRSTGFALISSTLTPHCTWARLLDADGSPTSTILADAIQSMLPNPTGGFVEVRTTSDGQQPPAIPTNSVDLRFVDDDLQPLGGWHSAIIYHQNIQFSVRIDQNGRALVLAFLYPPSFGVPPPPSEWSFSARWMDADGAVSDEFEPVAPIFVPNTPDGTALFAGWGVILPLPEGGFATYQYQASPTSNGSIAPTGWYARYASGESNTDPPPAWLQLYDGSLRLLAGGVGYAGIERDPGTCTRTAFVVAPSGRTCFTLTLEDTNTCDAFPDAIWSDGTVVLQNSDGRSSCLMKWWPALIRLIQ